jgi:hypothetical protein
MSINTESKPGPTGFLDDIEKQIGEIFSAQKSEVEQSLVAKISREKEDAQKRIEAVNQEFAQVRSLLDGHKSVMSELQTTEEHLRGEIRGHFDRAVNYQQMMENAAALAGDELEKIGSLHEELERVRVKAKAEYDALKGKLDGYAGLVAQLPAPTVRKESDVDWMEEIGKLRQVRDLMATLKHADNGHDGNGSSATDSAATAEAAEELAASVGLVGPADDGVRDDFEFATNETPQADSCDGDNAQTDAAPTEAVPADTAPTEAPPSFSGETEDEAAAPPPGDTDAPIELDPAPLQPEPQAEPQSDVQAETQTAEPELPAVDPAILEALARYRKIEPINNGIVLGFYATESETWLDAVSFMDAVGTVMDSAREQHSQLPETSSVKDLFLLKQEILNQQEILRKIFFRVVRFCDKEGGRLPDSLAAIVTSKAMKDIIERLTMANWSDPTDFTPFLNEISLLKRSFEAGISDPTTYFQSVLDEVEGRQN